MQEDRLGVTVLNRWVVAINPSKISCKHDNSHFFIPSYSYLALEVGASAKKKAANSNHRCLVSARIPVSPESSNAGGIVRGSGCDGEEKYEAGWLDLANAAGLRRPALPQLLFPPLM